jgi:hypothetical protein
MQLFKVDATPSLADKVDAISFTKRKDYEAIQHYVDSIAE